MKCQSLYRGTWISYIFSNKYRIDGCAKIYLYIKKTKISNHRFTEKGKTTDSDDCNFPNSAELKLIIKMKIERKLLINSFGF